MFMIYIFKYILYIYYNNILEKMTRSNQEVYGAVLKVKDYFLSCMELYTTIVCIMN